MIRMSRHTVHLAGLPLLALVLGCPPKDSDPATVTMTNPSTDPSSGPTSATNTTDPTDTETGTSTDTNDTGIASDNVDILFIVDNSGSMAPSQERLTDAIDNLIDPLLDAGLDLRIGITTTDVGNPRCPEGSTRPAKGNLILSSCVDRIDDGDFTFFGTDPPIDASEICTNACIYANDDLEVVPTATALEPDPKPRPWIELHDGSSNVSTGTALELLGCYLPQGIYGCGFESPLEAMYIALIRANTPGEDSYGFIREDATLAIIIITDETDCSAQDDTIFTSNKVFWNDPNDPTPTSAVCWRAGVDCMGDPNDYDCDAANFGAGGNSGASDDSAVLYPLSRYSQLLEDLLAAKTQGDVQLHVIAGVPPGYSGGIEPIYSGVGNGNPQFLENFGIDPACTDADIFAVPSIRERELAESIADGAPPVYSICSPDYSLDSIAQAILDQ